MASNTTDANAGPAPPLPVGSEKFVAQIISLAQILSTCGRDKMHELAETLHIEQAHVQFATMRQYPNLCRFLDDRFWDDEGERRFNIKHAKKLIKEAQEIWLPAPPNLGTLDKKSLVRIREGLNTAQVHVTLDQMRYSLPVACVMLRASSLGDEDGRRVAELVMTALRHTNDWIDGPDPAGPWIDLKEAAPQMLRLYKGLFHGEKRKEPAAAEQAGKAEDMKIQSGMNQESDGGFGNDQEGEATTDTSAFLRRVIGQVDEAMEGVAGIADSEGGVNQYEEDPAKSEELLLEALQLSAKCIIWARAALREGRTSTIREVVEGFDSQPST